MSNNLLLGAVAGAAGTFALDVTTYADMAARGRPPSKTPAETIRRVAESAGVEALAKPDDQAGESTKNRRSGLGALSGYGIGLSVGLVFGSVRPLVKNAPLALCAVALAAIAMAASDVPATKLEATDPSQWGVSGWIGDIVPHLAYGFVTAAVFDVLSRQ